MSLSMVWQDLTPELQAYYALTALQSPELAKAILGKDADPAFLAKIKADLAKTQVTEGTRATVERGRLDLSAMQTAIEGRLAVQAMTAKQQSDAEETGTEMPPPEEGAV